MLADLGVDAVGEVDNGRALRKVEHVALGRKDEDLFGEEVILDGGEEFLRVLEVLLPFDEPAQPGEALGLAQFAGAALLVAPVRGDSLFGDLVHLGGADLHFHPLPLRTNHRGMQRLVHVDLGQRDVILEAAGNRLPTGVDHAQRLVALAQRGDDDAEGDQVIDLVEVQPLLLHLAMDRIDVLGPPGYFGLDPGLLQPLHDDPDYGTDVLLALGPRPRDVGLQRGVGGRVDVAEGRVLQLRLEPVDAEPMRDRSVDFERLVRDLLLAVARQVRERAHVVQAVGELDEHDPDVVRHRDHHLAEVLGLLLGAAGERDLRNLGDAVDQGGDFVAEELAHLVERGHRVFDHVVQQAGNDRGQVELELGDDERDVERMGDVRLARLALLLGVHPRRVLVGAADQLSVGLRIVRLDPRQEMFELVGLAGNDG